LPIILKWGEAQQDSNSDVQGLSDKRMPNGDSELIPNKVQGRCYNNLNQNLEGDIIQDITQSPQSETVHSLDCRFSDLDKTCSKVRAAIHGTY
jgi:hypothetical protein